MASASAQELGEPLIRKLCVAALVAAALVSAPTAHATQPLPTTLQLPNGLRPEGITVGAWPTAYFGSMADGSIYQVNLLDGRGRVLAAGPGRMALGMKVDDSHGRLFVAGGDAGDARVIDTRTGRTLATYQLTGNGYVDDVVLTRDAAWFTDALRHQFYKLPLGRFGELPAACTTIPLSGAMPHMPDQLNSNGITTTPDGRALLIGHLTDGKIYRVDPVTGHSTAVDLGGESVDFNDGILRRGNSLYVAQVFANQVTRVDIDRSGTSGRVVSRSSDSRFDFPTAVATFGNRLYVVNASFAAPPNSPHTAIGMPRF
ncbi:superoxide dismutase [Kibdelosporangium philippinense]|uniref:Superoxide dismutase n=1 Tax=Kibdelosporangium philippinense TaxID=211113 RepID=A0ABS8Z508_9PSEU|nr:superoxide dismutase [Kibdelosporangium philippinense]MCE7002567.1 superoxide dismutase [Kibdelosporangium philippinense]